MGGCQNISLHQLPRRSSGDLRPVIRTGYPLVTTSGSVSEPPDRVSLRLCRYGCSLVWFARLGFRRTSSTAVESPALSVCHTVNSARHLKIAADRRGMPDDIRDLSADKCRVLDDMRRMSSDIRKMSLAIVKCRLIFVS